MGNYLTSPSIWHASPDRVCGYAHKHKRTTQSLRVSHEDALAAPSVKPVHLKRAVVRCHASPRFKWFGSFPWTTLCTNNPCLTPQLRAKVWLLPSFLTPGREQTQLLYISLSDLLMGSNHQTPVSFGGFWNPFTEHVLPIAGSGTHKGNGNICWLFLHFSELCRRFPSSDFSLVSNKILFCVHRSP